MVGQHIKADKIIPLKKSIIQVIYNTDTSYTKAIVVLVAILVFWRTTPRM